MSVTGAELRIRRMTAGDLNRVLEIARSLKDAAQWTGSVYLAAIDGGNLPARIALVAEETQSRVVAGFAVASMVAPEAELEMIAVATDGQRRGVGGRLFAALAREVSAAGVAVVHLEVRESNAAALGFYCRLGFDEVGRRTHYYAEPVEDALLLRLRLHGDEIR
jgi:[ribosomal protein S18]-alanine N-acetyltransferase